MDVPAQGLTVVVDRSRSVAGCKGPPTEAGVANTALLDLFESQKGAFKPPWCSRSPDVSIETTSPTSPLAASLDKAGTKTRTVVLVTDGIENDHPGESDASCGADRDKLVTSIANALDGGVDVTFACVEPDERCEVCADHVPAHERCSKLCAEATAGRALPGRCTVVDAGANPERLAGAASVVRCPSPGRPTGSPGVTAFSNGPSGAEPVTLDLSTDVALLGNDSRWHCTGVLLGRNTLLTAKHCLPVTRVRIGSDIRETGRIVRVAETLPHADRSVDAALVRLATAVERPRGFRRKAGETEAPYGSLHFEGFGVDEGGSPTNIGRRRSFDVPVEGWGCDRGRDQIAGCVPGTELVSPATGGLDTCGGDSGGPLFELWGDKQTCGWRLVAITSRSIRNGVRACGSGGIYVRVDAIAAWIDKTMTGWGDAEETR